MSVWVSPLPEALPIEPGSEASVEVTVRNDSEIVDEYALQLLGDAAQWSTVEPARLQLMPGTAAAARVTFRPPRDSALAPGPRPIGLKVASLERPDTSSVVEGMLDIRPYEALSVDLFPRTSHGSSGGKHEVALDNRGNNRLQLQLNASDPDNVLRFRFSPPVIDSEPGTASFARLRVRHKRRFLRGPARLRPFTVFVERGEDEPPLSTNGTAVQEQLFPTWALGALVGLAALALLWVFVLTPKVEDTAKNAADKQALHVLVNAGQTTPTDTNGNGSQNGNGNGSGDQNGNGSSNGNGSGDQNGNGSANGNGSGTGSGSDAAAGPPFSKRLQASCSDSCDESFKVPDKKTLAVTDIVLGNPNNAKGTLVVRNDGTVLLVENLDNFRDLDLHFGTPLSFPSGHRVVLALRCAGQPCSGAGLFSGTLG